MKPVNQAERQKAFTNFLLFFIATIILILAAVFFSVQVPFKQNEKLQVKVTAIESETSLAERFGNKLNETMGYFESVNKPGTLSEQMDQTITQNLSDMNNMFRLDSTMFKGLYQNIMTTLYDFQAAKKALRGASYLDANLGDLQSKLRQCEADRERLQMQNAILSQPH